MSEKRQFPDRLPKAAVAALVGLAIVTAFFVGKSVSDDSTPIPPVAAGGAIDTIGRDAAIDGYGVAGVEAPNPAPRRETVAVNAAAPPDPTSIDGEIAPPTAAPEEPAEGDANDSGIVALAPPPPETDSAESF
jgi:hypothetical protein